LIARSGQHRGDGRAFGDIDRIFVKRHDGIARRPRGATHLAADLPTRAEYQDFHLTNVPRIPDWCGAKLNCFPWNL